MVLLTNALHSAGHCRGAEIRYRTPTDLAVDGPETVLAEGRLGEV
jgi:hypothetical protein